MYTDVTFLQELFAAQHLGVYFFVEQGLDIWLLLWCSCCFYAALFYFLLCRLLYRYIITSHNSQSWYFYFFCVSTNRKVDPGRLVVWTSAVKMVVNILAGFVLRHNSIAVVVNAKNKTWQVSRWDQDAWPKSSSKTDMVQVLGRLMAHQCLLHWVSKMQRPVALRLVW